MSEGLGRDALLRWAHQNWGEVRKTSAAKEPDRAPALDLVWLVRETETLESIEAVKARLWSDGDGLDVLPLEGPGWVGWSRRRSSWRRTPRGDAPSPEDGEPIAGEWARIDAEGQVAIVDGDLLPATSAKLDHLGGGKWRIVTLMEHEATEDAPRPDGDAILALAHTVWIAGAAPCPDDPVSLRLEGDPPDVHRLDLCYRVYFAARETEVPSALTRIASRFAGYGRAPFRKGEGG